MISSLEFHSLEEDNTNLSHKYRGGVINEKTNEIKLSYILHNKCNEH